MRPQQRSFPKFNQPLRIKVWFGVLVAVMTIFGIRLFYLQALKHGYYKEQALASQLKEYEIPAERGIIEAHSGDSVVPIVLNETKYTLFADPVYVADIQSAAKQIQQAIGGNSKDYINAMSQETRYAVLAKKLSKNQKDKIDALELKGVGTRAETYRTYPQGSLAAQVLGFVNDDQQGVYGVEQFLNDQLKGSPGQLKAITDAQGVPLATNKDNVVKQPEQGKDVVLTIDVSMQKQMEDILKSGLDKANSTSGSALIMDPYTGAIKAMANYPSYNPAKFYDVKDESVFTNATVSSPLEVGSVMKTLTTAAAINEGVINENSTYYDPGYFEIDDHKITNVAGENCTCTRSIKDILQMSLNTGATWMLMQLGGGQVNQKARDIWYNYLVNHYNFGKNTGIEQGYEAPGIVAGPNEGYAPDLRFAEMAYGQGLTVTPLQLGAALSAAINGGTYYKPHLVDQIINNDGGTESVKPQIVTSNVVSASTSSKLRGLMEYVVNENHVLYGLPNLPAGYNIGGKTGTPEIASPSGGYYTDRFNGTFVGFVGGDKPEYVIVIRVNQPHVSFYAGAGAAAPIFSNLVNMLIDNFNVTPKTH